MVDGSAASAHTITSTSTSGPQHGRESTMPAEKKNNDNIRHNHFRNFSSESVLPKPTNDLQKTSNGGSRNGRNQNEYRHRQHRHHYQSAPYDSPFLSPAIEGRSSRTEIVAQRQSQRNRARTRNVGLQFGSPTPTPVHLKTKKVKPEPLVLDPNARSLPGHLGACNSEHRRVTLSSTSPASQIDYGRGRNSTVQKLFEVAKGIREHHATAAQYSTYDNSFNTPRSYLHATPVAIDAAYGTNATSAAVFARSNGVVQAGFLQKLGKNIPEFKRRFFVLKPETSLYYYLSPNDTEPRGKIDLEGSAIEQVEKTPDGRLRFIVSLTNENSEKIKYGDNENNDESHDIDTPYQQKQDQIVLEARSIEAGEEWIRHIKGERVSFLKERNESLTSTVTKQANQIADLEKQIEHFRMIEADRDGALEDAKNWKNKFNRLDEALRLLTQRIRKSLATPITTREDNNCEGDNAADAIAKDHDGDGKNEDANSVDKANENPDSKQSASSEDECHKVPEINKDKTEMKSNSAVALLDDLAHEDMDVEEIMDVPGTYFSGLSNACKQQKESTRLASIEASAAVEDVLQANEKVEVIQKRMHKAEKQILKLWEENCDIRKTLKQKKREKRVLVREVKQLQQTVQDLKIDLNQTSTIRPGLNKTPNEDGPMEDSMIGSDEERLIIELEEHVASSIRLHERLLAGTDFDREMEQSISTDPSSLNFDSMDVGRRGGRSKLDHSGLEKSKAKLLSLFDDESDSEKSNAQQEDLKDHMSCIETQSLVGSIASSIDHIQPVGNAEKLGSSSLFDTDEGSTRRVNPLLALDDNYEEESEQELYSAKPSSSKLITENGHATSRLVCPLADVLEVRGRSAHENDVGSAEHNRNEDLRVHHLTFYSPKIGLQFQKASPAPSKPRGLLTDAITADLVEEVDDSDKTAAELRSVASIASLASGRSTRQRKESKRTLSVPEDIVLVCGFDGFDDSGANQRPKLGARLVAFDGISVETGKWTFDSIRKAIKSRGRPLTLSFRNDFLTTEQRATLTKAIKDVDAKRDPVHHPIFRHRRPESTTASLTSASSYESGHFLNNTERNRLEGMHRPDGRTLDISTMATEESNCWNQCPPSSNSSISSGFRDNHVGKLLGPQSSSRFGEVGSSGTVSSLMNVLVKKTSASQELQQELGFTNSKDEGSKRNRKFGIGVNPSGTQQHQDFQANLL